MRISDWSSDMCSSDLGGTEEAIRISKLFLYQWHREGQLPYASMIENVDHGDAAILRCQAWLAQNYARPDIVAELVRRSGFPKRTFDRRFREIGRASCRERVCQSV